MKRALLWPVLWAIGWIADKIHAAIVHVPEVEPAPVPKATFRLWDKDFNLLATWEQDAKLCLTKDVGGSIRWSGLISNIEVG